MNTHIFCKYYIYIYIYITATTMPQPKPSYKHTHVPHQYNIEHSDLSFPDFCQCSLDFS